MNQSEGKTPKGLMKIIRTLINESFEPISLYLSELKFLRLKQLTR